MGMFPGGQESGGSFDDYLTRSKKAASYLRLLNHSKACKGACGLSSCRQTFRLLQHVADCNPNGNYSCEIKGCCTTKKLLAHVVECNAKISVEGDRKALCLVCTLASMPSHSNGCGEQNCEKNGTSHARSAGYEARDRYGAPNNLDVQNSTGRYEDQKDGNSKGYRRPQRSSTMVDSIDSSKENISRNLQYINRPPFRQPGCLRPPSASTLQINDLSITSSKPMEFIVPTMIPKRFRSNTLQHVATNEIKLIVSYGEDEGSEVAAAYDTEKWLGVDEVSRKIRVGQV